MTQGHYARTVCGRQAAGSYLDPCQWSAANFRTVTGTAAPQVPMRLRRGAPFILRVHDAQHFLPQVEANAREAVAALVTGGSANPVPLPIVYDTGRIRDFGSLVPMNVPLKVVVTSTSLHVADLDGAELVPQGISFQVTAADFTLPTLLSRGFSSMFRSPDAKVLHVRATSRK